MGRPRFDLREAPLLAAVFLDLLGFGMLIPDIQLRAEKLGASGAVIGVLLASMFIVQMLVSPRWGTLSDRIGRKPVFVACTLLSAAGMFFYGFADGLWMIFASRVLSGFGGANVTAAQAYFADLSEAEGRTAAMGRIGAAVSGGLIAGPALTAALAARGFNIGLVAGSASLLGVVLVAVLTPGVRPTHEEAKPKQGFFRLGLLNELPALRSLVLVAVIAWLSLATLEGTFGRLIEVVLHVESSKATTFYGMIFSYESVLGVVVQGILLAWISARVSDTPLLRVTYLLQGLGLAVTPFAPNLAFLFVASTIYAVGSGVSGATVNGLCSRLTPDARQGELFGLLQSTRSVGFVLGPIVGGRLFDWWPAAPYLLAGGTCVAASILVRTPKTVAAVA